MLNLTVNLFLIGFILSCNSSDMSGKVTKTNSIELESGVENIEDPKNEDPKNEDLVVSEPVSVGGAFLACVFPEQLDSAGANFDIMCNLNNVEGTVETTAAKFFYVSADQRTEITSRQENLFSWKLTIDQGILKSANIIGSVSINGGESVEFPANPSMDLVEFKVNEGFWMGGEPNNVNDSNPDGEDCVIMVDQQSQIRHDLAEGVSSGTDGRFNDANCLSERAYLCRSLSLEANMKWLIQAEDGPFAAGASACPAGYKFSAPLSVGELGEVKLLLDSSYVERVWINLNDREEEGKFVLN